MTVTTERILIYNEYHFLSNGSIFMERHSFQGQCLHYHSLNSVKKIFIDQGIHDEFYDRILYLNISTY